MQWKANIKYKVQGKAGIKGKGRVLLSHILQTHSLVLVFVFVLLFFFMFVFAFVFVFVFAYKVQGKGVVASYSADSQSCHHSSMPMSLGS